MKNVSVILAFFVLSISCIAQNGTLDTTFNLDGIVTTSIGNYSEGKSIALQDDGKIVVGATCLFGSNSDITVIRYESNGSLDTSFNGIGFTHADISNSYEDCTAIAVQTDGKIVVSGYSIDALSKKYIVIIRFNEDGTLDTNFGIAGKIIMQYFNTNSYGQDLLIQQDGKIVVAGTTKDASSKDIMIAIRYLSDGSIDNSFDDDGITIIDFGGLGASCSSLVQQTDGKLLLTGTNFVTFGNSNIALARLNINGSLDSSFDYDGRQVSSTNSCNSYSVKLQSDNKIVVAGTIQFNTSRDFIVLRYNPDGSEDTTFNANGIVTSNVGLYHDYCFSMCIEKNTNKIILGGATKMTQQADADFTLLRYNSSGELDTTFNNNGIVTTQSSSSETIINSIVIQPDGKIIAVGFNNNNNNSVIQLARYNNDNPLGILNVSNIEDLVLIYPNPASYFTNIKINKNLKKASIHVFDESGRKVKVINNIFGYNLIMKIDELSSGIYHINIVENNEIIAKKSFLIN